MNGKKADTTENTFTLMKLYSCRFSPMGRPFLPKMHSFTCIQARSVALYYPISLAHFFFRPTNLSQLHISRLLVLLRSLVCLCAWIERKVQQSHTIQLCSKFTLSDCCSKGCKNIFVFCCRVYIFARFMWRKKSDSLNRLVRSMHSVCI